MRKSAFCSRSAAAIALAICVAAVSSLGTGTATAATRVPFSSINRACDFSVLGPTNAGHIGDGRGEAIVQTNGNTVFADITFLNISKPGMHFDVVLIQAPRTSSEVCGPGAPGTASTGMDIDGAGRATAHVADQLRSGTTGVWLRIQRPDPHSQQPAEFYSSMFIAKV